MIVISLLAVGLGLLAPPEISIAVDATENVSADFPDAPRVESSAFGQWKGRWVFIGGRIAGYHATGGASAEFSRAEANREVWVVDSTIKPARTYHVPVALLPSKFSLIKDEWISTGQLYYQDGPSLYIAGGYGQNSSGHWVTYPLISKIDLPLLIDGVMQGRLPAESIRFSPSALVQSAGGELAELRDGHFYVVMGHVFMGTYTAFEGQGEHNAEPASQTYLNEIREITIQDDNSGGLTVRCLKTFRNENEFHRRDLNVTKFLSPTGLGLAAYGGVFTPESQLAYSHPIYLLGKQEPAVDSSFDQKMNAYKCARLLLYDRPAQEMYTILFGGISRFAWNPESGTYSENVRVGSKSGGHYLDGLQWSDQISIVRKVMAPGRETTSETVQPNTLPGFIGTDAFFIPIDSAPRAADDAGILDFTRLKGTKTLVGYLYGGIRAYPFRFPYNKTALPYDAGTVPTKPSDLILKVYVTVK